MDSMDEIHQSTDPPVSLCGWAIVGKPSPELDGRRPRILRAEPWAVVGRTWPPLRAVRLHVAGRNGDGRAAGVEHLVHILTHIRIGAGVVAAGVLQGCE